MKAKKKVAAPEPVKTVIAYKGFNRDLTCRDFKFEIGKEYVHEGKVEACKSGFHACENPLDVFSYYEPGVSRYAEVEMSGETSTHEQDSKIASARIKITAEIDFTVIVQKAIAWITSKAKPTDLHHSDWGQSASSATGYQSASSATGYQSASSATGDRSASSATGYQSASSATGDRSASSATGGQSASSATGDRSASSATGYQSASSATGDQSASSVKGKGSVAMSIGYASKSMASGDGAIVCVYRDDDWNLVHIRASKVGDNGIKPDTFYTLDKDGNFMEVE